MADWSPFVATADHAATPSVVFTDPQVASVGLTSVEAAKRELPHRVVEYAIGNVAGASVFADGYTGTAIAVIDTEREVLLGMTFIGSGVAEMVQAATIASSGRCRSPGCGTPSRPIRRSTRSGCGCWRPTAAERLLPLSGRPPAARPGSRRDMTSATPPSDPRRPRRHRPLSHLRVRHPEQERVPIAWPTATLYRPDGTFLITTSIALPQKAYNIRRDGRVAMLFSEPTASGLVGAPQVLVQGTATCPDEIVTDVLRTRSTGGGCTSGNPSTRSTAPTSSPGSSSTGTTCAC